MSPLISIIVTTYLPESKIYLDACIKSIFNLDYDNFEVILVGRPSYQPTYDKVKTVIFPRDEFGNSEGINFGVKNANSNAAAYFILNDDVILTKKSLSEIVRCDSGRNVLGPISNCDQYIHYFLPALGNMPNQYRMNHDQEEREGLVNNLISCQSPYPAGAIFRPHIYFYAVYISKRVWQDVGALGEEFKTGPDDLDFCKRASACGVPIAIVLSSLVWHASGVTAESTLDDAKRKANAEAWQRKWGEPQPFGL